MDYSSRSWMHEVTRFRYPYPNSRKVRIL